jgi:hypothetical protein
VKSKLSLEAEVGVEGLNALRRSGSKVVRVVLWVSNTAIIIN